MSPSPSGSNPAAHDPVCLTVTEASQVGEARRAAAALTARLGFGETEAGKVAIVVTEPAAVAAAIDLFQSVRDAMASGEPATVGRKGEAAC